MNRRFRRIRSSLLILLGVAAILLSPKAGLWAGIKRSSVQFQAQSHSSSQSAVIQMDRAEFVHFRLQEALVPMGIVMLVGLGLILWGVWGWYVSMVPFANLTDPKMIWEIRKEWALSRQDENGKEADSRSRSER